MRKQSPKTQNLDPFVTELEAEVIAFFVQLSRAFGQPRTLAELYGLLFISPRPLAMDDLIDRLGMSKGSASQGLRFLRNTGAIKIVYVAGSRRVHYEAVAELRNLAGRFVRDQLVPRIDSSLNRIDEIAAKVSKLPTGDRVRVSNRISMLQSWSQKSREFLPVVVGLLEG